MKYICPECGADVVVEHVLTYPGTFCFKCTKCDYHNDVKSPQDDDVITAPARVVK